MSQRMALHITVVEWLILASGWIRLFQEKCSGRLASSSGSIKNASAVVVIKSIGMRKCM